MANLTAETKNVKEVFQREYLIPEYQRPYSWEKEECEQLVDDVASFHKEGAESQYFLGCMVIAKSKEENEEDKWLVIDGQQRLTTLLLLIKALHKQAGTYADLEACYKKRDPIEGNFVNDMRLISEVIEGDKENLEAVLGDQVTAENRFSLNFDHIREIFEDKRMSAITSTSDSLTKFIKTLLDRVVLLPIECDGQESALTIFNTLNNRGTPLTDADIFKATLYRKLQSEQKGNFVNDWKRLISDNGNDWNESTGDTVVDLFRIYMHILRAKGKDTSKETALRTYFLDKDKKRLDNPSEVMDRLKKYKAVDSWESMPTINIWWSILRHTYPNIYWKYPLYVFMDKYGVYKNDQFDLTGRKVEEFLRLLESTVRYCFIKGVVTNTVNAIKDTIFKVCAAIAHEEDFDRYYLENSAGDIDELNRKLEDKEQDFGRYRNGLIFINSALHASLKDDAARDDYADCLLKANLTIEHILPRTWNHYDGWNESTHKEDIGKLGNLIPWEGKLNSAARNEFFARKKREYTKSRIAEVRTLCDLDKWSPDSLEQRDGEVRKRLKQFFSWGKKKA